MMESEQKYRKKIEVGMLFKDTSQDDVFYSPHAVIHDLKVLLPGDTFSKPLAAHINEVFTYSKPITFKVGELSSYDQEYLEFVKSFMSYFDDPIEWKGKRLRLVPVEKDPWVYKRAQRLIEITNREIRLTMWGILASYQYSTKDFVFSLLRPMIVTRDNFPGYPFRVEYIEKTNQLNYIYPKLNH